MTYAEFLKKVVDEGIEGARRDYGSGSDRHEAKLAGSIEGFEACRGKSPTEIAGLLAEARKRTREAFNRANEGEISSNRYWRIRCREAEIEWTANVVSAMLVNQGLPYIVPPTARAVMQAARIVGVKEA